MYWRLVASFVILIFTASITIFTRLQVPAPTATQKQVINSLNKWLHAWATKDESVYLAMYSEDFEVPAGLTRPQWEKTRKDKLKQTRTLAIKATDIVLEVGSPVAVVATFQQRYQSDHIVEVSNKMLVFIKDSESSNDWKIAAERTSY